MSSVPSAARAASKVFVTGATGTAGSETVSALRAAGIDVIRRGSLPGKVRPAERAWGRGKADRLCRRGRNDGRNAWR